MIQAAPKGAGIRRREKMKRLSTALILIIVLSTGALAHQGSIGLYTDQTATDCDAAIAPFTPYSIFIMYFRSDGGPNGIFALEFSIDIIGDWGFFGSPAWSPAVSITNGDIATGIAVSYSDCEGAGADYAWVGSIPFTSLGATSGTIKVGPSTAYDLPIVAMCDDMRTLAPVLGGYFTAPDGSCDIGTEESSWGAIKSMYK